jgi:hypothetical protein
MQWYVCIISMITTMHTGPNRPYQPGLLHAENARLAAKAGRPGHIMAWPDPLLRQAGGDIALALCAKYIAYGVTLVCTYYICIKYYDVR